MDLSTRGLVLREVNYKESDKILTVLTEDGKLTVSARGARKKVSKYTAASQLLTFSELDLYQRHGRWSLREGRVVELFTGLRQDIMLLSVGAYFAELLEAVSDVDYADPGLLAFGLNGLHILSNGNRNPKLVKAAFELRLMCHAGYTPDVSICPRCQAEAGLWLSLAGGRVHCRNCRPEQGGESVPLDPGSYSALQHIVSAQEGRVFSFSLGELGTQHLCAATEAYVLAQLERGFRTLEFLKKVL